MNTCPDCKCEFVQPFRCATCGAQKLYDHTVTSQQQTIDALRARVAELQATILSPLDAQTKALHQRVAELEADVSDARGLLRGMIDAKDGRVARLLMERAERFIERTAGNKTGSRDA